MGYDMGGSDNVSAITTCACLQKCVSHFNVLAVHTYFLFDTVD